MVAECASGCSEDLTGVALGPGYSQFSAIWRADSASLRAAAVSPRARAMRARRTRPSAWITSGDTRAGEGDGLPRSRQFAQALIDGHVSREGQDVVPRGHAGCHRISGRRTEVIPAIKVR